ncbi:MAG: hypothetical protein Q8R06_21105 [Polaromonas sp.]|uniref:VMAP-C domain-containing protein n=1 Tax=Polaromonas sp. TaxID=1869339 RepID=UPI0027352CDB|nr:hypothetical protein [Polaromonas sp.]MDP3799610.1 hypothetical protein [Polaromonas sp.]
MLETAPSSTLAIVVGIDHYEYGEDWQLAGPAADALRCVDWLTDRGVPPDKIALFLSQKSWTEDEDVVKWAATRQWAGPRKATRSALSDYVDKELPGADAQALFVFWGGHGVVDDFQSRNYLFTEDATDGRPYCVAVQDLMGALHGQRFENFVEQMLVVDACSNPFADTGEVSRPSPAAFARSPISYNIKQFQIFSASEGKLAANVSERRSGRFTEALFGELKRHTSPGWPDFQAAFDDTLTGVERLSLGLQQPFLVIDWPGRARRRSGRPPSDSARVTSLLALIESTSAAPALLYRLYKRSVPDINRALGHTAIEQWLRDLDDSRPRDSNMPSPLIEFAERLTRELRGTEPQHSKDIIDWVNDNTKAKRNARNAMRKMLDTEMLAKRPRATLFMEIDADPPSELRWWVHAPDPVHCSAVQSVAIDTSLQSDIAARLRDITAEAEHTVGHHYDLMVGIIVPEKLLIGELESTKVQFEDGELAGPPIALNRRYPVTLHWHKRARAKPDTTGRPFNAWRQALSTLEPRIAAGGGADVVWLESAAGEDDADPSVVAAMKLLSSQGTGICVGVGHAPPGQGDKPPADIIGCLREGVPCFFWLAKAPKGVEAARKLLCDLFSQQKASEAPMSIGMLRKMAKGSDLLSSLRIVWDEPGHLPPAQAFEGPAMPGKT